MDHYQSHLRTTLSSLFLIISFFSQSTWAGDFTSPTPSPSRQPELSSSPALPQLEDHQEKSYLLHLNLGFPIPMGLGLNTSINRNLHLDLTATYLPIPFIKSGALATAALDGVAQWHPGERPFFLFGGLGIQTFLFHASVNLGRFSETTGPEQGNLSLTRIYTSLGIGVTWISGPSFYLESDIGLQIPISKFGKISFDQASEAKTSLEEASRDALSYYAGFILPRITLIRFGMKI